MYEQAKKEYAAYGIDTEAAIKKLKAIPVSIHCWQGDDVAGLDGGGELSGGIQNDGQLPRQGEELRRTESGYKESVFADARQKAFELTRKLRGWRNR